MTFWHTREQMAEQERRRKAKEWLEDEPVNVRDELPKTRDTSHPPTINEDEPAE